MAKEVIFFIRAYNDMDIQLSLMAEFAQDSGYRVRVIGFPSDGFMGAPQEHEAAKWLQTFKNVSIETVFDYAQSPLPLKTLYRAEGFLRALRKKDAVKLPVLAFPLKVMHVGCLKILTSILKKPQGWMAGIAVNWNPSVIIIDEVLAQQNRSQIVDDIIPSFAAKGVPVYVVQTGQHVYPEPFSSKIPGYKRSCATRAFVPAALDQDIYKKQFPDEKTAVMGNLRMDRGWIKTLNENILVKPYRDVAKDLDRLPKGKIKIAFMLSKLSYGVEVENLKELIRTLGHMAGVAVAIKPHTRGMKFDFMSSDDIGNSIDARDIPSAVLTEWADMIVMTGSSVIFHAMVLQKQVGFLKYCQENKTIFDDGACCHVFNSKHDMVRVVQSMIDGTGDMSDERIQQIQGWMQKHVHAGAADGLTARRYKAEIEKDLAGLSA